MHRIISRRWKETSIEQKFFYPCIQDAVRWGNNYCNTNKGKTQWEAERVSCQGTNKAHQKQVKV